MTTQRIFFLGGQDLEMLEIKNLLIKHNENFKDKNLSWGAKLSEYQEELEKYKDYKIYGIELKANIQSTKNYIEIDHHGKNDHKPSSLEQVANILGVKLTKEQKLIVANDSRYINGMRVLCATQEKIDEIRAKDRAIQGITEEDEVMAKNSFENTTDNYIFSQTPKFSALSDLAYNKFDKYVIYNFSKVVFYGYKKGKVLEFLNSKNISENNYYYGGGDFGFVGIKEYALDKEDIEKLLEEFRQVENKKELYSYHTFMLPFRYEKKEDVVKNFCKSNTTASYNEQAYFHKFFIKSMFENCEIYDNTKYKSLTIKTKDLKKFKSDEIRRVSKTYTLKIDKIGLRIFDDFGVGVLSFHLENKEYKEIQEILEINDYTRRVYPEYFEDGNCDLVPEYIILDNDATMKEDFTFDEKSNTPNISKIIINLIGSKITPAIDDRMFTMSFFNSPVFANQVKENYICNDKWHEYVFVDGDGKTVQSEAMQKELIKNATYDRWKDYSTMYGMSRYSFVCLANSDFPLQHMRTMYFSMFSLLLMIRATLLKFTDDVSKIASEIDNDISKDLDTVYKDYIKFINKYYFREITAKDQGLELYEKALDILKIGRDIKDLDNEIEELHSYVGMIEEEKRTTSMGRVSKMGSYFLLPAVVTGFFGMNIIDFTTIPEPCTLFYYIVMTAVVILSALVIPTILKLIEKNAK